MRGSTHRTLLRAGMATVIALACLTGAACNKDKTPTPTTPTPTTPTPTTTETFSGELKVNGASTYPFGTAAAGSITVTLTTVDPGGGPSFGLSLGTWNGASCQTVIANDAATLNVTVTGTVTAPTALCARVYDAGRLTDPLTYTITVVHP
jgi:hypothetical protein